MKQEGLDKTDKQLKKDEDGKCQGFLEKIRPEGRGWRFFLKPGGLDLDNPGRGIIFFVGFIHSAYNGLFNGK